MKYLIITLLLALSHLTFGQQKLPKGFAYLTDYVPHISQDLRYFTNHNFVGKPIDGYKSQKLILSKKAAIALAKVEKDLNKKNLGLKVFDAYRPQSAVNHFKRWAADIKDTTAKKEFYPYIDKRVLFKQGYIASKSGHSRGSTIDLTIIDLKTKKELDMGTPFDYFGPESGHNYNKLNKEQTQNRKTLKSAMQKHGFKAYSAEWWHYTLIDEPYKSTYFDFPVE